MFYDKWGHPIVSTRFSYEKVLLKICDQSVKTYYPKSWNALRKTIVFFHALSNTRTKSVIFEVATRNVTDAENLYRYLAEKTQPSSEG